VTNTLLHTVRKAAAGGVVHTYVVDIGSEIEIHGIGGNGELTGDPFFSTRPLNSTRFFEVTLDATRGDSFSSIQDILVLPVHAERSGGFSLFGFALLKSKWVITERPKTAEPGGRQWAYTDDFNLLLVSSGDTDPGTMAGLIFERIDSIARSIRSGTRAPSHAENRQIYRESIYSFVADERIRTEEERHIHDGRTDRGVLPGMPHHRSAGNSSILPGAALPEISAPALRLAIIEEINDASWLFE